MRTLANTLIILSPLFHATLAQEYGEPGMVGGMREWKYLLEHEMQYPYSALQAGEKGTVSIDCYISPEGELEEIEFVNSVSEELDREAVRLLKHVVWKPAVFNVQFTSGKTRMFVKFYPERYYRYCRDRGYRQLPTPVLPVSEETEIYKRNEVESVAKPLIPEGWEAYPYILKQLKYPEEAVRLSVQGKVRIAYVVERSGHVTNIEVLHTLAGGCPQEVVRVLRSLNWIPAIADGQAVRSRQEITVLFQLNSSGTAQEFIYNGQGIY